MFMNFLITSYILISDITWVVLPRPVFCAAVHLNFYAAQLQAFPISFGNKQILSSAMKQYIQHRACVSEHVKP